jgi:hypothetical protein
VLRHRLKAVLKRGALIAAANWPVVIIQAVADSLFKVLVTMPLIGGIFLVALAVGAEPGTLISLAWRDLMTTIVTSLIAKPAVLIAFLGSLSIVIIGGSLFVFLVKAGTVGVLVRSEESAGPIEQGPLHYRTVVRTSAFSLDTFEQSARRHFPRYARLGGLLMGVYLVSGGGYLLAVIASRAAGESWAMAALITAMFVTWITVVNLAYLLMQIVIAAEECSVGAAWRHVGTFVRRQRREVAAVFFVILAVVVFAQGASLLAATALGLIAFVPLLGLTVWPLQLVAWLFRSLVFQYIGLSSVGAYVRLYRGLRDARAAAVAPLPLLDTGRVANSGIRPDGAA